MSDQTVHEYCVLWLIDERKYQLKKFGIENDDKHIREWSVLQTPNEYDESWWSRQFENYYFKAATLGLDNPAGRQALAKHVATALGMLEAAVRVYGELPKPGVTSGENLNDLRKL